MNQIEQPVIELAGNEERGKTLSDVMTIPSTRQHLSQVGARYVDRETNTSEVEVRPQREETRTDIMYGNGRDEHMPISRDSLSSHETDIVGGYPLRPCITNIMLKLDGPTSVHTRRRPEQVIVQKTVTMLKRRYPDESDSNSHDNRRQHDE